MRVEQIQEAINTYRKKFEKLGIGTGSFSHDIPLDNGLHGLEHCYGMLSQIEEFLKEGKIDKVYRWLGFIQGVLWADRLYTLSELKSHNKPNLE